MKSSLKLFTALTLGILVSSLSHAQWTDDGPVTRLNNPGDSVSIGLASGSGAKGKLHILSDPSTSSFILQTRIPGTVSLGTNLGKVEWFTSKSPGGSRTTIISEADATWASGTQPTRLSFWTTSGTTLTERMRINSSGDVGIATTSPAYKLDVNGDVYVHEQLGVGTTPSTNIAEALKIWGTNDLTKLIIGSLDPMTLSSGVTGGVVEFGAKFTLQDASTQTPIIFADENQGEGPLVGIGTTTPQAELDIAGKARMTNFQLTTGAGAGYFLMSDATGLGAWDPTLVGNAGNIGIGTGTPNSKLEVTGDIRLSEGANRTLGMEASSGGDGFDLIVTAGNGGAGQSSGGDLVLSGGTGSGVGGNAYVYAGEGASASFDGDLILAHDGVSQIGNVGIGTASPSSKLEVAGTVSMTGFKMVGGAQAGYVLQTDANGVGTWQATFDGSQGTANYVPKFLGPNVIGNSLIFIDDVTGYVGIGATTPTVKLHVSGNVNASSTMNLLGPGTGQEGGQINLANATNQTGGEANAWTIDNASNDLRVFYNSGAASLFIDDATGNVGVGTVTPGTDKLVVNGTIKAQDIILTLNGWQQSPGQSPSPEGKESEGVSGAPSSQGWPDFVFDEEYDLMPIDELAASVQANRHLPGIPRCVTE